MTLLRLRWLPLALLALAPAAARAADSLTVAAPASAANSPVLLADSTVTERWKLPNGLEVTTRHIDGARTVAVVLGFRIGSDLDPVGQEGLAQLMGELLLTAPAGDTPARTAEEMNRLRPEGWDLQVGPHLTLLTEVATPQQLAGVLSQLGQRLRGVSPSAGDLQTAMASVRTQLGQRYFGPPAYSLYYQVRELGLHSDDQITLRKASGKGIERTTLKQAQERLRRLYVPANAVLSVAGDLDQAQLHALVQSQFANIPSGVAVAAPVASPLTAYQRVIKRTDLPASVGVIAVIAPPVTDPLHPSFYLGTMLLGGLAKEVWGGSEQVPSRYRYSVFGDPDLAMFYPPTEPKDLDTDGMGARFDALMVRLRGTVVDAMNYDRLRESLRWQLGGPLSHRMLDRVRQESPALTTLATAMAARSLWMGEPFWADYLRRLDDETGGAFDTIVPYLQDHDHQVRLLFSPGTR